LARTLLSINRNFILKVLEKNRLRQKETTRSLGIPLSTLKYKLSKLHIYNFLNSENGGTGGVEDQFLGQ